MHNRRDFFRQFIGQFLILNDEVKGKQNIPLNRLHELPNNIVERIVPVFFTNEDWHKEGNCIRFQKQQKELKLNAIEAAIFELFNKPFSIKKMAAIITQRHNMPYNKAFEMVSSLFFNLAKLRVCHPNESLDIAKLLSSK
ncbi:MAG: hypothetical protein PF517_21945 [Salinivirgaceae bacterium]|jgi:hypothetical protein|nr:hypothetical protein [Salinivirgaceae bacterium]